MNLGDSLVNYLQVYSETGEDVLLEFSRADNRELALEQLMAGHADVLVVLPGDLTPRLLNPEYGGKEKAMLELVGDIRKTSDGKNTYELTFRTKYDSSEDIPEVVTVKVGDQIVEAKKIAPIAPVVAEEPAPVPVKAISITNSLTV